MKKILSVLFFAAAVSFNISAQNFSRELKIQKPRLNGKDVELVQQKLFELGYLPEEVDGWFGPKTESAVKEFQKENGFADSGVVDETTYDLLKTGKAEYVVKVNRSIAKQNFEGRFKAIVEKTVEGEAPFPVGYVFTIYLFTGKKNDEICRRIDLRIVGDGSGWQYKFYCDWYGKIYKVERNFWTSFDTEESSKETFYIENGKILLIDYDGKNLDLEISKEKNKEENELFQSYLDMLD